MLIRRDDKLKKIYLIVIIFIFSSLIIGSVSATDSDNSTTVNENNVLTSDDNIDNIADDCCADEPKTWYVSPNPENPNQVQAPTVQPAINEANPGDTIVLNGSFVHCHFTINKTLTIKATPGTSVGVCPHHNHPSGSDTFGIFYFTPESRGSVLEGFEFTNNYFSIANVEQNPFAVLIDGANDIELKDLTINWTGVKVNQLDPQDYVFKPIIIKNARNITLNNVFLNNTLVGITIENSTDIKIQNSTIANSKENGILIGENSSLITVTDNKVPVIKAPEDTKLSANALKLYVGDSGNLKITLKTSDDIAIANKNITVYINGAIKKATTDNNGVAIINVKYATANTYYVTAAFLGDDDYKSSIASNKITVIKKATSLKTTKKTFKAKAVKKVSVTLKDNAGKVLKNKKVILKVNGKTYKATTNSKGIATFKVKLTKKGTFKYTAKYAGNSAYKAITKTNKIIVK